MSDAFSPGQVEMIERILVLCNLSVNSHLILISTSPFL